MNKSFYAFLMLILVMIETPAVAADRISLPEALSAALKAHPGEVLEAKTSGTAYEIVVKGEAGGTKTVYVDFSGNLVEESRPLNMVEATEIALKALPGEVVDAKREGEGFLIGIRTADGVGKVLVSAAGEAKVDLPAKADTAASGPLTMERAAAIALGSVPGQLFKIQFAQGVYDVDIKTDKGTIEKVYVDLGGNILAEKKDIGMEDAIAIVKQQKDGEVHEKEEKKEYYEIHIRPGDQYNYMFRVDKKSGEIIKTSKRKIYIYDPATDSWSD